MHCCINEMLFLNDAAELKNIGESHLGRDSFDL